MTDMTSPSLVSAALASEEIRPATADTVSTLYERPLRATRTGPLYGAFPYPTKISPESIALFIATHTNPGDTVFDGFAGSGTTGLAALLCEDPPVEIREQAKRLGLQVNWGARNAVLYELSALGSFVAGTLTNPPDPAAFRRAAAEILADVEQEYGWMYEAKDINHDNGKIRYTIWSDQLKCPACHAPVSFWEGCVGLHPARIGPDFTCPQCAHVSAVETLERLTSTAWDDVLGISRETKDRRPYRIHGRTGSRTWYRLVNDEDLARLAHIASQPLPDSIPQVSVPWGDLYRRGYHTGISHVHHFYTRRNLIAFGQLWERVANYGEALRDALRFWLLSYNASHSTIMTRVVAKSGHDDFVVTSAQPGVLYVSGLPVEKNLFDGLNRKLNTVSKAFDVIHGRKGNVEIRRSSSCQVALPDASIDYVFTDPPFGGNIPYAEVNFINEAWLGQYTDRAEEITVSDHQGKTSSEYTELLSRSLAEVERILKPNGKVTLVFHSASAQVWNALQSAYTNAGLGVTQTSILHKTQDSFKQITTNGAVKGDPVLLLTKQSCANERTAVDIWDTANTLRRAHAYDKDPEEQTVQRRYSRFVNHFLVSNQPVPIDANIFYRWCKESEDLRGNTRAVY